MFVCVGVELCSRCSVLWCLCSCFCVIDFVLVGVTLCVFACVS